MHGACARAVWVNGGGVVTHAFNGEPLLSTAALPRWSAAAPVEPKYVPGRQAVQTEAPIHTYVYIYICVDIYRSRHVHHDVRHGWD